MSAIGKMTMDFNAVASEQPLKNRGHRQDFEVGMS
jgi:hypothetical protein